MLVSVITHPEQIVPSLPYADALEYRLDFLKEVPDAPLPRLFTFRKKGQGGALDISEEERLTRLEKILELEPEYCDLETETDPIWIKKLAKKFPKTQFIGSYHNFSETPEDLETLFQSMQRPEFSYYKIAVHAKTTSDMLRLFACARTKPNLAWVSMGKAGQASRVLASLTGSPFSYGTLLEETPPLFQINLQTLTGLYRTPTLNRETKIYALLGNPVDASIGHIYHNRVFAETNVNAVYVKFPVLAEELQEVFNHLKLLPFAGISITMPYKRDVIPLLDALHPDAEAIGAVNTIRFENGKAYGYNTDGIGAADALEKHMQLKDKKVALLGAGGASRAIAFELIRRGAKVTLFNRTFETAEKLAAHFQCQAAHFENFHRERFDLWINTVPSQYELPVDLSVIPFSPFVMDIAVSQNPSPLLLKASSQGSQPIEAKEMFCEQAKQQQIIWAS